MLDEHGNVTTDCEHELNELYGVHNFHDSYWGSCAWHPNDPHDGPLARYYQNDVDSTDDDDSYSSGDVYSSVCSSGSPCSHSI